MVRTIESVFGLMFVPPEPMKLPAGNVVPGGGVVAIGPSSHLVIGAPPLGGGQVGKGGKPGCPAIKFNLLFRVSD